jgi:predicted SprT family Zn-dependent metalloprotease
MSRTPHLNERRRMNPSDAIEFAQELIVEYGLLGWRAELDRAVSRFGVCRYSRKLITLSNDLVKLNNQACVLDVILHEIAHALAGPRTGHGPEWKRIARSIGCSAQRCYSLTDTVQPPGRFVLCCAHCGQTIQRVRAPRRVLACPSCCNRFSGGRFDPRFALNCEAVSLGH